MPLMPFLCAQTQYVCANKTFNANSIAYFLFIKGFLKNWELYTLLILLYQITGKAALLFILMPNVR